MPLDDTDHAPAQDRPGSPFRHAIYRNVWLASLLSNFGGMIQSVAAAWLMASISPSLDLVALVQTATTLPIMLFSLVAGALADSFERRKVMLAAQIFLLHVSLALALTSYFGVMTPWLLLFFTFLLGCGVAFNGPAWQSLVGDMVPRADLPAAIALNSIGFNLARSFGPAIGGMIVAAVGAFGAFVVNAFTYTALIAVLARWRPPQAPRLLPRESLGHAMAAGIRYVAMSPNIGAVLLRGGAFGVGAVSVQALMPLIARDLIGGGPRTFGVLLGAFGAGAISGAAISNRMRARLSMEKLVRLAFLVCALCAGVAGVSRSAPLTVAAMALGGASWVLAMSSFNTTVQLSSPRWVVGRAVALYQMSAFGGMAAGAWLWGAAAEAYGVANALLGAAMVLAAGAAIGLVRPLPELQALDLNPLNRWREPDIAIDIKPLSGPIVITIEYTIEPEDALDFLTIMAERKRIRMRDGARRWTLLRDLENERLWVERYHLPTWLDYVRHNQRLTQADGGIREKLLALDHSEPRPRVHRMIERQVSWTTVDPLHKTQGDHPSGH